MKTINLHIKNMVCPRCIYIVENILKNLRIKIHHIELGFVKVTISNNFTLEDIDNRLKLFGFSLLKDKDEITVERIKVKIIEYISRIENNNIKISLSFFLAEELGKNYNYLSKLYSFFESKTIVSNYIDRKIERAKELLEEDELNISEIARRLGYSNMHYLSNQFKHITGITPTEHKNIFRSKINN